MYLYKMFKKVLLFVLIAFVACENMEVLVFRGQIPLLTCAFNPSCASINPNYGSMGIKLKNCRFSQEAEDFEESINDMVYRSDSASKDMIIPYRFLEKFSVKTTNFLGATIGANFRDQKTESEYKITLAFGFCKNDLDISTFNRITDCLENARIHFNQNIQEVRKAIKQSAGLLIAHQNTLDELNSAHTKAKARIEELKVKNAELER